VFENIKQVNASGETPEIQQWLISCLSDLNQIVIVFWSNRMAALVQ
jgi:hypothetical protein